MGVTLDLIACVGTKDATSNSRAYPADFMRATRVERRGGFEIALELTTKGAPRGSMCRRSALFRSIDALRVPTASILAPRAPPSALRLRARFGAKPRHGDSQSEHGPRFVLDLEARRRAVNTLVDRTLHPSRITTDREPQTLDVKLSTSGDGRLLFRIEGPADCSPQLDGVWWADVAAE